MDSPVYITQMFAIPVKREATIEDADSAHGKIWSRLLRSIEKSNGFCRLYWGRHLEEPDKTSLHVVRENIEQHQAFLKSDQWRELQVYIATLLASPASNIVIRHVEMKEISSGAQSLAKGAPYTGTAIYLAKDAPTWEAARYLWSKIITQVPGNLGVAGGRILESVDGHDCCYAAYVGWESIEQHTDYHHTKDFQRKRVILTEASVGFREYGHVIFPTQNVRTKSGSANL